MPKFVLIDHSIRDLVGHHYEYANHVLTAAARAGYEPLLATNRSFAEPSSPKWRLFPVYEFGFWTEDPERPWKKVLRSRAKWAKGVWFACKCRLRYSHLGLAWLARTNWRRYLSRRPSGISGWAEYFSGASLIAGVKLGRLLTLILLFPFVVLSVPLSAFWRWLVALEPAGRYLRMLGAELRTYPDFVRTVVAATWRALQRSLSRFQASSKNASHAFARDTATLFRRLALDPGDVIFLPTVSPRDALGLLQFLGSARPNRRITWHLLFRRDLDGSRPPLRSESPEAAAEMRWVLTAFRKRVPSQEIYFYTDSDELTDQYNELGVFRFTTLPIPHTHPGRPAARPASPLQVAYLGDARKEKGYHLLPCVVGDLRRDCLQTGKIRFVFQSNYNVPGGEPEAVIARAQLESFPVTAVTLHKQPLSPEEYRELLLSADVLLFPYDRRNYHSRSSGILVEALAAGIPVVVPAGTWLSRQLLKGKIRRYFLSLRNSMEVLQSHHHSYLSWYFHSTKDVRATWEGRLEVSFDRQAYCWLDVPQGATHLLVVARFKRKPYEGHLKVTHVSDEPLSSTKRYYLQGDDRGDCALVFTVQPQARRLWFALGGNTEREFISIEHLEIDFLAAPAKTSIPLGRLGLAYHDVAEIPDLIREIVDHYDHYRTSAVQFASHWRKLHNSDRLILEISQNAGNPQLPEVAQTSSAVPEETLV